MAKFCLECKHCVTSNGMFGVIRRCNSPKVHLPNMVTGEYGDRPFCELVRQDPNRCGVEGVFFVRKEQPVQGADGRFYSQG